MPYIDCKDAWCDYPESCQSDHWVPNWETCPHCHRSFSIGKAEAHISTCTKNPKAPKAEPKCDHYWLVRKGGLCRECGTTFQKNYGRG